MSCKISISKYQNISGASRHLQDLVKDFNIFCFMKGNFGTFLQYLHFTLLHEIKDRLYLMAMTLMKVLTNDIS